MLPACHCLLPCTPLSAGCNPRCSVGLDTDAGWCPFPQASTAAAAEATARADLAARDKQVAELQQHLNTAQQGRDALQGQIDQLSEAVRTMDVAAAGAAASIGELQAREKRLRQAAAEDSVELQALRKAAAAKDEELLVYQGRAQLAEQQVLVHRQRAAQALAAMEGRLQAQLDAQRGELLAAQDAAAANECKVGDLQAQWDQRLLEVGRSTLTHAPAALVLFAFLRHTA